MEKDTKLKKRSVLSNETKATIGTIATIGIIDVLLPKEPPQKGTGELLSVIIWVGFLVRFFVLLVGLFYFIGWFIIEGLTEVKNVSWVSFQFSYIPFFITVLYFNKLMYERKQFLSIVFINLLNCWMLYYLYTS